MHEIRDVVALVGNPQIESGATAVSGVEPDDLWAPENLADDRMPHCDVCRDGRYVQSDAPEGHENHGRYMRCPACWHYLARRQAMDRYKRMAKRISNYGIQPRADCTFDSLVLDGRPQILRDAVRASRGFANTDDQWLVLWGPVGTGKTHLAMAVANDCRARYKTALLADVPGLLDLLRSGYEHDDYSEIMALAQEVDYLLLDDVGTEKTTDWGAEKLFQIINNRYNAQRPIMLTMNERPDVALSPRLASRVMDIQSTIINLVGSDYRIQRRRA
jgi:DNA replication protein DnaC